MRKIRKKVQTASQPEVEPLHDRILVERLSPEEEAFITQPSQSILTEGKGVIVIPDAYRSKTRCAKVLAVGPGAWRDGEFCKTAVKPGDVVILPGIAAVMPDWESKDKILIQEGDVGAILGDISGDGYSLDTLNLPRYDYLNDLG